MDKRLEFIDIAKGIGIVLVVCSHSDALGLMWLMMGMFVPIFYFSSGFTFSMKGTLWECFKKRFRKLIVPYLFFNIFLFCTFMHFSLRELVGVFYSRYSLYPLNVSPNIKFMTSGNYPLWFLTSMITTYLFFYLIVYFYRLKNLLLISYFILTFILSKIPILLPWSIDTAFLTALFMYAGMRVRDKGLVSAKWWQVGLILLVYIGLHLISGEINLSVRVYGTSLFIYFILGCFGSYLVLWGSRFLEGMYVGKFFLILGKNSLTIFCLEIPFIILAENLYKWLFPCEELGYMAGVFEIFLALMGGLLVSVLLQKNKILKQMLF